MNNKREEIKKMLAKCLEYETIDFYDSLSFEKEQINIVIKRESDAGTFLSKAEGFLVEFEKSIMLTHLDQVVERLVSKNESYQNRFDEYLDLTKEQRKSISGNVLFLKEFIKNTSFNLINGEILALGAEMKTLENLGRELETIAESKFRKIAISITMILFVVIPIVGFGLKKRFGWEALEFWLALCGLEFTILGLLTIVGFKINFIEAQLKRRKANRLAKLHRMYMYDPEKLDAIREILKGKKDNLKILTFNESIAKPTD